MIDLNHKNHQFVLVNELKNEYICTKCNNLFWYQDKDSKNNIVNYRNNFYMKKYYIQAYDKMDWREVEDETCDELIIKDILE